MRRVLTAIALAAFACGGSPTEPNVGTYALVSIRHFEPGFDNDGVETSLPTTGWPFPNIPAYSEVTAGSLFIRQDSLVTNTLTFRCQHPLPPGASCQLPRRRRIIYEGVISRIEDRFFVVSFTDPDALAHLDLRGDNPTLVYSLPPSLGGFAVAFEYQR